MAQYFAYQIFEIIHDDGIVWIKKQIPSKKLYCSDKKTFFWIFWDYNLNGKLFTEKKGYSFIILAQRKLPLKRHFTNCQPWIRIHSKP